MPANVKTKITGNVTVPSEWWKERYNFEWKNPVTTDIHTLIEDDMWVEKILHENFPDLPIGSDDPQPYYGLRMYDYGKLIAMSYGAPVPVWDTPSTSFWHDREAHPWGWVEAVKDVAKIEIPDWSTMPAIRETVERYYRYLELFPGQDVIPGDIFWTYTDPLTGQKSDLSLFVSFIDMGPIMFGIERFFEILASEEELAHALMDKCFEISCSLSEFFLDIVGKKEVKGLFSFGGDFSFFFSPTLFHEYGLGFDNMLLDRYGKNLPANLHSCGASPHLYPVFAEYTNQIVLMQTRGIPGTAGKLREALPKTRLEITIGPPQFDPRTDNIRDIVRHYVEAVGGYNVAISLLLPYMGDQHDGMVREFYAVLDEWNSAI